MKAATLFSGIGAPETAMPEWQWLWCAEIEPFPSAVLCVNDVRWILQRIEKFEQTVGSAA